ncbi:Ca(2+)-dependent cysteine protease [Clathrus columnatus]|uniref:Ca(2+)-dependent cysteine protease n=1 Tax=Clathrus columnatus TaxID=1419009 RepID=A0AAV5A6M6_9AGAM|nr:Ca(2+)-dependent cysteine protease [Clathrus columnatus]
MVHKLKEVGNHFFNTRNVQAGKEPFVLTSLVSDSGHGGQTKDLDGDEDDGYDEVIYPVDYQHSSHIVDDEMHRLMVKPLPPGCRLTAIYDAQLSQYSTEGKIKEPNLILEAGQGIFNAATSYMRGDMHGVISGISSVVKTATGSNRSAEEISRRTRTSPADVISWSGCKDSQTSADTIQAGTATGAMSTAFIKALSLYRKDLGFNFLTRFINSSEFESIISTTPGFT